MRGSPSTFAPFASISALAWWMSGTSKQTWCWPPAGFFGEEAVQRAVLAERLDQLYLAVGRVDEADPHALRRQVERLVDPGCAEHVAIERDALLDRWGGDADMVEAAEIHSLLFQAKVEQQVSSYCRDDDQAERVQRQQESEFRRTALAFEMGAVKRQLSGAQATHDPQRDQRHQGKGDKTDE